METLSYGFKKPQDGDKGQTLFDDLALNVQLTNDHLHNGVDSAKLSTAALVKLSQTILSAAWVSPVDGLYSQTVAMVGGLLFDETTITIRETSTGKLMSLVYEKVSDGSFKIYCNDATVNATALYA